jgi:antitoxin (DNA-binding transcriptional repressor) of toxin-antitoxin stability system
MEYCMDIEELSPRLREVVLAMKPGEEIGLTKDGKIVARLIRLDPDNPEQRNQTMPQTKPDAH